MELEKKPVTEQEYWEIIEAFGYFTRRPSTTPEDIQKARTTQEQLIREACDKFNLIHPENYPARKLDEARPPTPEGQRHYYDWYEDTRRSWLASEYHKLVCSACPLSEGEKQFIDARGNIPCAVWNGVLYDLPAPHRCAMLSFQIWSRVRLFRVIHKMGGKEALSAFLAKEIVLSKKRK